MYFDLDVRVSDYENYFVLLILINKMTEANMIIFGKTSFVLVTEFLSRKFFRVVSFLFVDYRFTLKMCIPNFQKEVKCLNIWRAYQ